MKTEKLADLIQRKNERLEMDALQTAESHIDSIIRLNAAIEQAKAEIKDHQEALKKLEIQTVSPSILGE